MDSSRRGPTSRSGYGPQRSRVGGGASRDRRFKPSRSPRKEASRFSPGSAESDSPHRTSDSSEDRLQKILAQAGLGSRRKCEELISSGRITVDGQVMKTLGTKVRQGVAEIAVDGVPIQIEKPAYYAVNKPKGYVSTNFDPDNRPRVIDLVPEVPQRVYTVGRLDEASVGLILLTNDGELAHRLAHPRFGVEKTYRAVVAGKPNQDVLDQMCRGVWIAEGKVRARRVRMVGRQGDSTTLELVLAEGKNREVRRMMARLGHKVMSLARVSIGPLKLGGLKPGQVRRLTREEIEQLRSAISAPRSQERSPTSQSSSKSNHPSRRPSLPKDSKPKAPEKPLPQRPSVEPELVEASLLTSGSGVVSQVGSRQSLLAVPSKRGADVAPASNSESGESEGSRRMRARQKQEQARTSQPANVPRPGEAEPPQRRILGLGPDRPPNSRKRRPGRPKFKRARPS